MDAPLTDYCPDISRIIRVDCTPFTESCDLENGKAVIGGKAVYDVLYETDNANRLKFCSFTQDFSHSVNIPRLDNQAASVFCNMKCEKINCKILSPRRIIIKAVLCGHITAESEASINIISPTDGDDAFFKTKSLEYQGKTQCFKHNYDFSDSLSLSQNEKSIGEILCGSIFIQQPQITLSQGRAEIKTSALIKALCEEESNQGQYYVTSKVLPLNIDFRNEQINENENIRISLNTAQINLTPELDQYGESRMIKADFNVEMTLFLNQQKSYAVAEDMFEKHYESIPVSGSISPAKLFAKQETNFSAEAKLPEMLPRPTAILDTSARESIPAIEQTDGGIKVSGNFTVTLLAKTQDGIYSFDHIIPYEHFLPMDLPKDCKDIPTDTYPIEVIATLHSDGSATARIIAGVYAAAYTEEEYTFITQVTKRTPIEEQNGNLELIYRFPEKGEALWDIAKSYRVCPAKIEQDNPEAFDQNQNAEGTKPILIKL